MSTTEGRLHRRVQGIYATLMATILVALFGILQLVLPLLLRLFDDHQIKLPGFAALFLEHPIASGLVLLVLLLSLPLAIALQRPMLFHAALALCVFAAFILALALYSGSVVPMIRLLGKLSS